MAKPIVTLIHLSCKLDKDEQSKGIDKIKYRGMIGSLMYLTSSRPNISFSVGLCLRFQFCPKEFYLAAVKRIFRYLLGTQTLGLWYPRTYTFDLVEICDVDYAGDKIDRKSMSDYCTFLDTL